MKSKISPLLLVPWVVWIAILNGVLMVYFVIGKQHSLPEDISVQKGLPLLIPFVLSMIVRHGFLLRSPHYNTVFLRMIIGLALADASCFIGVFLVPELELLGLILSILAILQYIPFYMNALIPDFPSEKNPDFSSDSH
ncbi:MAG: hypothetical protein V4507_04935 [Verrucomicrobiota bacterium]